MLSLSKARTLDEYGDAGYVLAVFFLTLAAWTLETLAQATQTFGPLVAVCRDTLKEVLSRSIPSLDPVLRYLVSLPALVAFGLVLVGVQARWRRRFGRAFAVIALLTAGAVFSAADFFFRRRTTAAVALTVLAVLLTLGSVWQRAIDGDRALSAQAYQRWLRSLTAFVDSTSLSRDEQERAQRLMSEWALTRAESDHPAAAELIGSLQILYGTDRKPGWEDRVREASKREPKARKSINKEEAAVVTAHQVVLGRTRLRRALDEHCTSPHSIDAAATMFSAVKGGFDKSVAYGMTALYRCALDHLLLPGNEDSELKLCLTPVDCARGALDSSEPDGTRDAEGCETPELKRRNNRLDVLVRLAVSFDKLAPMPLKQARSKPELRAELEATEKSLQDCGQLHRLRDSVAFRTLAEARAAAFTLSALPPSAPLSADAKADVEQAGRWLVAARYNGAPRDQGWDMSSFCGIVRQPEANQIFVGISGDKRTWSECSSSP